MRNAGLSRAVTAFAAIIVLALALPSLASALSFQETSQSPLPGLTSVNDIATGDFDGDGDSDLAVADETGVVVWLSNGDGTFTEGETLPIDANVNAAGTAVVVGDFNHDGSLDLAYADGPYKVYIALGDGNGTFIAPDSSTKFPAPFFLGAGQLAVGDFNGDENDDLVAAGGIHNGVNESAGYQVFTSDGDGTFTPKTTVPVSIPNESSVIGVAVGNYNGDGDGDQDLALLTQPFSFSNFADNQLDGEIGQGNGTFTAAMENPISLGLTEAGFAHAETTANLNGSGGDDLLVTTSHNNSTVPLLGSSSDFLDLNAAGALEGGPALAFRVAAADVTGDGLDDAIPAYFDGDGSFGIGLSNSSGDLTPAEGSPFSIEQEHFFNSAVATGDFNGDGSPDIAVASNANTNGGPLTQGVAVMINSPELAVAPTELDFGDTNVGEPATQTVTLTGLGAPGAEVSQIELSGEPDSPFSIGNPSACETVSYEERCEVEVEYAPTSIDTSSDTLSITSDTGPGGSDALSAIALTGRGIAPGVELSPASQAFGSLEIGGTPVAKSFAISSTGDAPLTVTGVSLSSEVDFKLANPSACVGSVAEGKSCAVGVSFNPAAGSAGSRSATLTVETDAGDRTTQLSGTAESARSSSTGGSGGGAGGSGGGAGPAVPPTAKLKLKAPAVAEAGKQVKLKVQVTNTGDTPISGLTLKVSVPKKLAEAPKAVKLASLAAGKTVIETIKVKIKDAGEGTKVNLAVTASAGGKTLAKASRKVKVE
jgi:FG-GAP-like repeat/NPCBM-associated, NEW3 domain of alpha-galactosidase